MAAIEYSTRIGDAEMHITPAAQSQFVEILASADDEIAGIRVFVSGGGCSGMAYGMTYADATVDKDYDSVLEGPGFKIYVDPIALNYLQGCEIDFRDSDFRGDTWSLGRQQFRELPLASKRVRGLGFRHTQ